jgi:hypothetical protein
MKISRKLTTLLLLIFLPITTLAARTDAVLLINGNTVTGEVESLEFGDLEYSTDSMGTVHIDWEDVIAITSNRFLQVEVSNGTRFFGNLEGAQERFYINVVTEHGPVEIAMSRIVRITPIDTHQEFIKRLEGAVSLGINAQKGSQVSTFNGSADIRYRTREYLVGLSFNSSITDQPSEETQSRHTVRGNYQRFRPNRWYTDWYSNWERNDELGIAARFSAGVGIGRYIVQTNRNQFSLMAGAQATREEFTGEEPGATIGEGRIQIRYLHRNLKPETGMHFTTNIYPLLESPDVFRTETDLTFKREFFGDLDFEINIYHSYQSEAPPDGERTDSGIVTGISWDW